MPTYRYRCANHHVFERFLRVREHDSAVSCESCELVAQQVITAPLAVNVAADIRYDSPIDGRPITSHAARQEDLKRNDCIPYDPEMKKDADRRKREMVETFERGVEETVCQEIARLPAAKKAALKHEVVNMGADLTVAREGA